MHATPEAGAGAFHCMAENVPSTTETSRQIYIYIIHTRFHPKQRRDAPLVFFAVPAFRMRNSEHVVCARALNSNRNELAHSITATEPKQHIEVCMNLCMVHTTHRRKIFTQNTRTVRLVTAKSSAYVHTISMKTFKHFTSNTRTVQYGLPTAAVVPLLESTADTRAYPATPSCSTSNHFRISRGDYRYDKGGQYQIDSRQRGGGGGACLHSGGHPVLFRLGRGRHEVRGAGGEVHVKAAAHGNDLLPQAILRHGSPNPAC